MGVYRYLEPYELFEATGAGRGCFAVAKYVRDAAPDEPHLLTSLWETGSEGEEWCESLCRMSDADFLAECEEMEFS